MISMVNNPLQARSRCITLPDRGWAYHATNAWSSYFSASPLAHLIPLTFWARWSVYCAFHGVSSAGYVLLYICLGFGLKRGLGFNISRYSQKTRGNLHNPEHLSRLDWALTACARAIRFVPQQLLGIAFFLGRCAPHID